uniref:Transmembrane protein n=1 Tax=Mesocestoides corti TaxID=53468 RepID=A0A5K3FZG5_MESCO
MGKLNLLRVAKPSLLLVALFVFGVAHVSSRVVYVASEGGALEAFRLEPLSIYAKQSEPQLAKRRFRRIYSTWIKQPSRQSPSEDD